MRQPIEPTRFVEHLRADSNGLVLAATAAGIDRPVPSCPGWTLEGLLAHTSVVHGWVRTMVHEGAVERLDIRQLPAPPRGDGVIDWFRDGAEALAQELEAHDPDESVWTWTGDKRVAFWYRRMAHETAVHHWDAAMSATGQAEAIDRLLADDGIDEVLAHYAPRAVKAFAGAGETIHLHATDAGDDQAGEWLLTLDPHALTVTHAHVKADVAVRATTSDLLLFLWGRASVDQVDVFGDRPTLDRWVDSATF